MRFGFVLCCFVFFVFVTPILLGEVITEINVSNSRPYLSQNISNYSWAVNGNLTHAFDLDNHFSDPNGDVLTYSHSVVENISIVIDSSNRVSFYSDPYFSGTRTVIFYANDGTLNASSNVVALFVGLDTTPPYVVSISKDKTTIYQNDIVNFTALWRDNYALLKYFFSINQGGVWQNFSNVSFSGVLNSSYSSLKISAPGGTSVLWKFCAYDTSFNFNCSVVQNFEVTSRPVPPSPPSGGSTSSGVGASSIAKSIFGKGEKEQGFIVEQKSFKVSLKQGEQVTRVAKITNTGTETLSFNLSIEGVSFFVKINENSFSLSPGENRRIVLEFGAPIDTPPDQYFGQLNVKSNNASVSVPIVIDVNLLELILAVNVSVLDDYSLVKPGKVVKANISVNSLVDPFSSELILYTAIEDFYGNVYDSASYNISFDSSYSFIEMLTVPAEAGEGEYIFYARAVSRDIVALDSDFFEVGVRFKIAAFLRDFFIFIFIILLSLIVSLLYIKYRRQKNKERILSLYLMLNELKQLIKDENFDAAVELFIRIKTMYGESVSKDVLQDKGKLKEEIKILSKKLIAEKEAIVESEGEFKPEEKSGEEASGKDNSEKGEIEKKKEEIVMPEKEIKKESSKQESEVKEEEEKKSAVKEESKEAKNKTIKKSENKKKESEK